MHGECMNRSNKGADHSFVIITFTFPLPFRLTELASVSCVASCCIVSVAARMEHGVFKTVYQIKNQLELRGATIVNQSLLKGLERHMEEVSTDSLEQLLACCRLQVSTCSESPSFGTPNGDGTGKKARGLIIPRVTGSEVAVAAVF